MTPKKVKNPPETIILPIEVPAPIPLVSAPPMPPTTTEQEDIAKAGERSSDEKLKEGQRRINLVWELTQAFTTSIITIAAIYCAVNKIQSDIINFAFVAVISTYYTRTNHTKTGGVVDGQIGR